MPGWKEFRSTAIVPAFRELRRRGIFATVQNLACCQSCAHAELVDHPSYVFFHQQDQDRCRESESDSLTLYLGFEFESAEVEARALTILKKYVMVHWNGDHRTRIVVTPKVPHWTMVRKWVTARNVCLYWKEQTSHLYAIGGVGRKRDREAFEGESWEV